MDSGTTLIRTYVLGQSNVHLLTDSCIKTTGIACEGKCCKYLIYQVQVQVLGVQYKYKYQKIVLE